MIQNQGRRATGIYSRRQLLALGSGVAIAGLAVGQLRLAFGSPRTVVGGEDLIEPAVRMSSNGYLETTLEARLMQVPVGGSLATTTVYEGMFPGPTLRVRAGDQMLVRLVNRLDQPTNLHSHGLHVSPAADSDNVLHKIPPGESFDYLYAIPIDQPAGLNWVHSHASGDSDAQVFGGLASAIIIEGDLDRLPEVAGVLERLLVLQTFRRDAQQRVAPGDEMPDAPYERLVNGQSAPAIRIRPGQTQRWRILNASADTYFLLHLADHPFHQIAADGNTLGAVWTRDQILMPPGKRIEVLIQGGPPGVYELRTLPYDKGPQPAGMGLRTEPEAVLATLVSEGSPETPQPLPTTLLPFIDLRSVPIDQRREITFDVPAGMPQRFAINGQVADLSRVDLTVRANTTEEWVIRNTSDQVHPFHIHVNPFQVIAINGEPVPVRGYEDVVNLPRLGEVTIRQRFAHFTGTTVFHCHILMHEDLGMLAVFQIVP